MTVIVTGATGFLGGAVARSLLADGEGVVGLGRDAGKLAMLGCQGIKTIEGDLAGWNGEAPSARAVIHCAGLSSPWGTRAAFMRANVDGTVGALRLAEKAGADTFVHISTPSVTAAMRDRLNVDETAPLPKPINAYARSKRAAEDIVAGASIARRVILRPRGLYGPGDTALLPRLVRAAQAGPLPLMREGRAVIDLTFIEDAVSAVRAALGTQRPGCRIYHVSGGEAVPVTTIAERAAEVAGVRLSWRRLPVSAALAAAALLEARAGLTGREPRITRYGVGLFAYSQTLDISRICSELGWQPRVSFADGVGQLG